MQVPAVLEGTKNERIVLTHVTRRTHLPEARRLLKQVLPAEVRDRVTFLMSWKHVQED